MVEKSVLAIRIINRFESDTDEVKRNRKLD